MDTNPIGSLVWKVIGRVLPARKTLKEPCVMCGKHEANPTQYFEDELFAWCDVNQVDFNLSEFDAEIERLELQAEQEMYEAYEREEPTRHHVHQYAQARGISRRASSER